MLRRGFMGVLVAASMMVLGGCASDPTPDYRYRLTVEVDTPEGLRTGSSVIEVETDIAGEYAIPTPGKVSHRVRGEAATVELGDGRALYALLRSRQNVDWATNIMFLLTPGGSEVDGSRFLGRFGDMLASRETKELPETLDHVNPMLKGMDGRPMLVTFADESDPTSVSLVDPDDLAATFGEGVTLRRITVQLTNDPVTTGIEQRLAWFEKVANAGGGLVPMIKNSKGRYEVAPGFDDELAGIGLSNFSTEAYAR